MNEYRFHLQKYINRAARPSVRGAEGSPALPVISTRRERFLSRDTWVNATTSTVVAITIPRKNTSGTIRQQGKHRLAIK